MTIYDAPLYGVADLSELPDPVPAGAVIFVKADGDDVAKLFVSNTDGTIVPTPVSAFHTGDYSGATAYSIGDIVRNQNSTWIAVAATTGNSPPTLPTTSNAYWELLAKGGDDGTDGISAGFAFTFSTTTTMADPGTGIIRLNNATPASATAIAIDAQSADSGNPDVSDEIASWADSTSTVKGRLTLRKTSAAGTFISFDVTGVTDNTGWLQLAATVVDSNGTLSDTDALVVQFSATGDVGDDGTSAFLYVAYASDNAGTGFSLTPSGSLKYRAEIQSATEIASPDAGDFSGATWVKYLGDDGSGLESVRAATESTPIHAWTGSAATIPLLRDANGETLVGYNAETADLYGVSIDRIKYNRVENGQGAALSTADRSDAISDDTGWTGVAWYGQSNALGSADGDPPVSTSQPYSHLTFTGGPLAKTSPDFDTTRALYEQNYTGSGNSETPTSGTCNFAATYAARKQGRDPASMILFGFANGAGGTALASLDKGSGAYASLMDQVTKAKALATAAGKSFTMPAVCLDQGESDLNPSVTARTTYRDLLLQLQADFDTDIKAITGQTSPVHLLVVQTSYYAASSSNVALAQMDAAAASDYIHISHASYFLPFDNDDTHRSIVGHLRQGRIMGRTWAQLAIEGRNPDWLKPKLAYATGTTVSILFDVPTPPLVLDIDTLTKAQDFGFAIEDDTGVLTISRVRVADTNRVEITIDRALDTNPEVRYALDYLAWTLQVGAAGIDNGASGNLRDSTADIHVLPAGGGATETVVEPHWCPHFSLPILELEA